MKTDTSGDGVRAAMFVHLHAAATLGRAITHTELKEWESALAAQPAAVDDALIGAAFKDALKTPDIRWRDMPDAKRLIDMVAKKAGEAWVKPAAPVPVEGALYVRPKLVEILHQLAPAQIEHRVTVSTVKYATFSEPLFTHPPTPEAASGVVVDANELAERVARAMHASENKNSGWTWEECSPIEVKGWMELADAAIAALNPAEAGEK